MIRFFRTPGPVRRGSVPLWRRHGRFEVARLHRRGLDPLRFLVVTPLDKDLPGGEFEGFFEHLLQHLGDGTVRGVDLDLLAPWGRVLQSLASGSDVWRSARFDAVLLLTPPTSPSRLERQRAMVEAAVETLAARSPVRIAQLEPGTPGHGTPVEGSAWPFAGAESARKLAGLLLEAAVSGHGDRPDAQDESDRQAAVERLGELDRVVDLVDRRLRDVVQMAQRTFDLPIASINLIDGDRLVTVASAGSATGSRPREWALCNQTIQQSDLDLHPDTWAEPSLAGNPMVQGRSAVRFYAAYPIESIDGYRLGALCVYDTEPHEADEFDFTMLRDLALLAAGELDTLTTHP